MNLVMAKTQLETACSPQKMEGAEGERRTRTPIKKTINPSMALSGLSHTAAPRGPWEKTGNRFSSFGEAVSGLSAETLRLRGVTAAF